MSIAELFDFARRERGLVYVTIGNTGSAVFGALFWFILAMFLEVGDYGEVNYHIASASVPAAIGLLGLDTTVTTYLAKGDEEIMYESSFLILLSSIVLSAVTVGFNWLSPLIIMSTMFFRMSIAEILGRKRYIEYASVKVAYRLVQIGSAFFLYFGLGVLGILVGYVLGQAICSYRFLNSLRLTNPRIKSLRAKVNFTMHSFGLKVSECLSTSLDKVIVGAVFGFYALGIYQLGFQFVLFLSIIPLSLHSYLLPEEASGRVGKNVKFLGFLLAVIAAGLASSLAPYILEIFFRKFSEGADVVGVMCISIIPIAVTKILNASLLGRENSKKVLLGGLVYVLSLALGFVTLGTLLGIHGLAISVVLASAIQAGFLVLGVVSPQVGAGLASQRSKATTAKGLGEESW